jgi:hypothetical protein
VFECLGRGDIARVTLEERKASQILEQIIGG